MRALQLSLILLCLCALSPCLRAGEYQPNTQEWAELISMAENAKGNYANLVRETEQRIQNRGKTPNYENPAAGYPVFPQPTIEMLEALLQCAQKTDADLGVLLDELKAMKVDDRTRALYLKYLRPVKQASCQYTLDRPGLFQLVGNTGINISGLEADIKMINSAKTERLAPVPLPKGLQLSWLNFPRLDGSTTAQPLSTLLACRLLGLGAEWHVRKIRDFRNSEGTSERILIPACGEPPLLVRPNAEDTAGFPGLRVNMVHSGTSTAYCNLIAGAADLIIVARPPSPDETALAKEKQVELELRPIGYDAFIFLLHRNNPLSNLTTEQIRAIYADNILNWSEVGGKLLRIVAYQRERNSGSQETMESLVMKELEMAPPVTMLIGYGMGGPYNLLYGQENGIGYTFYYYHTVQSPENPTILARHGGQPMMKACAVNGVVPSSETIRNRTYPFVTEVYAVVRKDTPKESSAVRMRDWLLTPEGQAIVKESGYVPLPGE